MAAIVPGWAEALQKLNLLLDRQEEIIENTVSRIDDDIGAAISGAKIYVNGITGNDTADGSQATPYATFAKAFDQVVGNTVNIIHMAPNQTYTNLREALRGTIWTTGNTIIMLRRYDTAWDDATNFPTLDIVTQVEDGKDQVSQMLRYKGRMHLIIDDVKLRLKGPSTPLGLAINRSTWFVCDSGGGGQPFDLTINGCGITTEAGAAQLFNGDAASSMRIDLDGVDLTGPTQVIKGGANCAISLAARNVSTTGTKFVTGTIGQNAIAPSHAAGLFA